MRAVLFLILPLVACARADYQWTDPQTYQHTLYPKTLGVVTDTRTETFAFDARGEMDVENLQALRSFLGTLPPGGAESIRLTFSTEDEERQRYVIRLLRSMGYQKRVMHVVVDSLAAADAVKIALRTATAALPDCPDWRKSSNTNYSNTIHSNMRCATTTNLGRMLANPRDVEKSPVRYVPPDGAIDAMAIGSYHGNTEAAASATTAATSTSVENAGSTASETGQ